MRVRLLTSDAFKSLEGAGNVFGCVSFQSYCITMLWALSIERSQKLHCAILFEIIFSRKRKRNWVLCSQWVPTCLLWNVSREPVDSYVNTVEKIIVYIVTKIYNQEVFIALLSHSKPLVLCNISRRYADSFWHCQGLYVGTENGCHDISYDTRREEANYCSDSMDIPSSSNCITCCSFKRSPYIGLYTV